MQRNVTESILVPYIAKNLTISRQGKKYFQRGKMEKFPRVKNFLYSNNLSTD